MGWLYLLSAFIFHDSSRLHENNSSLDFETFLPLFQGLRDKIFAQAEGKLFI
jgi:hypothetical protein